MYTCVIVGGGGYAEGCIFLFESNVIFYVMRQASRGDSVRIYQGISKSVFKSGKMLWRIEDFSFDVLIVIFIISLWQIARAYGVRILLRFPHILPRAFGAGTLADLLI